MAHQIGGVLYKPPTTKHGGSSSSALVVNTFFMCRSCGGLNLVIHFVFLFFWPESCEKKSNEAEQVCSMITGPQLKETLLECSRIQELTFLIDFLNNFNKLIS